MFNAKELSENRDSVEMNVIFLKRDGHTLENNSDFIRNELRTRSIHRQLRLAFSHLPHAGLFQQTLFKKVECEKSIRRMDRRE
jgi:hypothetical protein